MLASSLLLANVLIYLSLLRFCSAGRAICWNARSGYDFLLRAPTTFTTSNRYGSVAWSHNVLTGLQRGQRGVYALNFAPRGQLLLTEQPALYVARNEFGLIPESYIVSSILSLPQSQQQELLTVCSNPVFPNLATILDQVLLCFSFYGLNVEHGAALFLNSSHIKHSCLPNAEWHWNVTSEKLSIVTMKEVQAGEEITVSYLKEIGFRQTAAQRQVYRGIACDCPACMSGNLVAVASDRRRILMDQLFRNILEREQNKGLTTDHLWQNFHDGLKLRDLLEEEGLVGWERAMSYNVMASAMARYGDHELAEYYFEQERDYYRMLERALIAAKTELQDTENTPHVPASWLAVENCRRWIGSWWTGNDPWRQTIP